MPEGSSALPAGFTAMPSTVNRDEELIRRFTYHPPKPEQLARYDTLRSIALQFAMTIAELTPSGREQALALTHLEEAVFFATAAIARRS